MEIGVKMIINRIYYRVPKKNQSLVYKSVGYLESL